MKKEELNRLKLWLLAGGLSLTVAGCGNKEKEADIVIDVKIEKEDIKEVGVFFVGGKALIYEEGYEVFVNTGYSAIANSTVKYKNELIAFSTGVEAMEFRNLDDAKEMATAIVGEENIIYINFEQEYMNLSYTKKLNK